VIACPHPTKLLKPLELEHMVASDRNLFCDHYMDCLDEAASHNWASWSCAQCSLSEPQPRAVDHGQFVT
jgi:hypothetical protein